MPTLINIPISGPDCDFGGAFPVDVDSADSLASQPASNNPIFEEEGDDKMLKVTSNGNVKAVDFFRSQFNLAAFELCNKKKNNRRHYSQSYIDTMAHIIKHWDTGDFEFTDKKSFRREYKKDRGYWVSQNFTSLILYNKDGESTTYVFRMIRQKDGSQILKQVVSAEDTFGIIHHYHSAAAHKKVASTYNRISEKHDNITIQQVAIFCSLCPTCASYRLSHKNRAVKGAARPINSTSFHAERHMRCDKPALYGRA